MIILVAEYECDVRFDKFKMAKQINIAFKKFTKSTYSHENCYFG